MNEPAGSTDEKQTQRGSLRSSTLPRWGRELGEETWTRINELLHDGFDANDVVRELELPEAKRRSLQVYARKFGPRRRLLAFAAFKDALLSGAVECSKDFAKSLSLIAQYAVSEKVKPGKQLRAVELLTKFTQALSTMMSAEEKVEAERGAEPQRAKIDAQDVLRQIMDVYGVRVERGDGGK